MRATVPRLKGPGRLGSPDGRMGQCDLAVQFAHSQASPQAHDRAGADAARGAASRQPQVQPDPGQGLQAQVDSLASFMRISG